jgi:hypothetical protein
MGAGFFRSAVPPINFIVTHSFPALTGIMP